MDIIKINDKNPNPAKSYNTIINEIAPTGKIISLGDSAREHAILNLPYFRNNKDKIDTQGINLDKTQTGIFEHFEIKYGNANNMPQYNNEEFDCVISFMMFEHNPEFWLALSEMKRILKKNGILILGVPGYNSSYQIRPPPNSGDDYPMTVTYGCHGDPDCYRFSHHFFRYVAFKDFDKKKVYDVMIPPRLIGVGYK